jgi:hypothetical protein
MPHQPKLLLQKPPNHLHRPHRPSISKAYTPKRKIYSEINFGFNTLKNQISSATEENDNSITLYIYNI